MKTLLKGHCRNTAVGSGCVSTYSEDPVTALLGQATEILDPQHHPKSEAAINYARACADLASAYAAQSAAISAAKTTEAAQHTVELLTQIQQSLSAIEEQRGQ